MNSRTLTLVLLHVLLFAACHRNSTATDPTPVTSLADARRGFSTVLTRHVAVGEPAPPPPPGVFRLVHYPSPAGSLAAYVGIPPKAASGKRSPAIVWLVGGFSNSISEIAWSPGPPDNDQSATAFREAGIVMMYPSLRGGNDNRGLMEGFYGEVDDVLAAVDYLAHVEGVDPDRIYLGGHSTGGTLALLVAESRPAHLRAVFSFGPAADVAGYSQDDLPFDLHDARERKLRAPRLWLNAITVPCQIIEGTGARSNIASLRALEASPHPANVQFHPVADASHFSTLQPLTRLLARKIVADSGGQEPFALTDEEIAAAFPKR